MNRPRALLSKMNQSLQKRPKRIKETSDVEKKQDQTMNQNSKNANTNCQDSTPEKSIAKNKNGIVTTIQPSSGTMHHHDEKETREETEPKLSQAVQSQRVPTPACSDQSKGMEDARTSKQQIEGLVTSDDDSLYQEMCQNRHVQHKNDRDLNFVDARPNSGPTAEMSNGSVLDSPNCNTRQATKENLVPRTALAEDTFVPDSSQNQAFDEECFLDVANQIYETLSAPRKSLLLGQLLSSDDERDDSQFLGWHEIMAVVDALPASLDSAKFDNLDKIIIKRSNSVLKN